MKNSGIKPLVSICCVTYNHEKFIKQCLEGFVMQQTNFSFEILVHEDASTDNTAKVIKECENKYPHLFKCIYQTENQFLKENTLHTLLFPLARGKYIAMCEGDDYWTDPLKLQKQVDFLEANDDCAITYHSVNQLTDDGVFHYSNLKSSDTEATYTVVDLALFNFIHTVSVVFRKGLIPALPEWFDKTAIGDYPLHMLNAKHGLIKFFPEVMAVYRLHSNSVWSGKSKIYQYSNIIKTIDYLLIEFEEKEVIANLNFQKFKYLKGIADEYLKLNESELFNEHFRETSAKEKEFPSFYFNSLHTEFTEKTGELRGKLSNIQNSKTYKLLKKMRIFK